MAGMKVEGQPRLRMAPRVEDRSVLDRVVSELREIERRSGIERTLAIGELILAQFFAGDPAAWRDRRRNKNNSIRRIADRKDCPFCKSALNEAVAIYVAVLELPRVRTFGHIGASHVASVLTLEGDQRLDMLERAEREQLSVRELRKEVVSVRRCGGERRGRPPLDAASRALSELESDLRRLAVTIAGLKSLQPSELITRRHLEEASRELACLGSDLDELCRGAPQTTAPHRTSELRLGQAG
jgi:hypothetical protein